MVRAEERTEAAKLKRTKMTDFDQGEKLMWGWHGQKSYWWYVHVSVFWSTLANILSFVICLFLSFSDTYLSFWKSGFQVDGAILYKTIIYILERELRASDSEVKQTSIIGINFVIVTNGQLECVGCDCCKELLAKSCWHCSAIFRGRLGWPSGLL